MTKERLNEENFNEVKFNEEQSSKEKFEQDVAKEQEKYLNKIKENTKINSDMNQGKDISVGDQKYHAILEGRKYENKLEETNTGNFYETVKDVNAPPVTSHQNDPTIKGKGRNIPSIYFLDTTIYKKDINNCYQSMPQSTQRRQVDRNQFSQDDQFAQYRRNRNVSQSQLTHVANEQPSLPYSNQPVIPNKIPQLYQNKQITKKGKKILIFFPSIAKLLQIDALSYLKQRAEYLFFPFQIQFSLNMFSTESLNLWVNVSYFFKS